MTPKSDRPFWQAMQLALDLGWMIVVPLVLFALGGRLADTHYGTSPWLLLTGMGIAVITTTLLLISKFSKLLNDINQQSRNDKPHD